MAGEEGYAFSLTTFSPSGKLLQIEHALKAVQNGKASLGIQGQFPLLPVACPVGALLLPAHSSLPPSPCPCPHSQEWRCDCHGQEVHLPPD
jgi:hypothetical protein